MIFLDEFSMVWKLKAAAAEAYVKFQSDTKGEHPIVRF